MTYTQYSRLTPSSTPRALALLLKALGLISIGAALLDPLFLYLFEIPGPQHWLSLSASLLSRGGLWTPFTYPFVLQAGGSLHFFFFIRLFFDLYILWMLGGRVMESVGAQAFLRLFFLSSVVGGVLGLLGGGIFSGPTAAIMALLVVWSMMNPEAELLLFFTIPLLARWLVAGLLGMLLLISLSDGAFGTFLWYLGGAATGYLYGLLAWDLRGPFTWTHPYDQNIARLGQKLRLRQEERERSDQQIYGSRAKIVDFRTGRAVLKDDEFMDAMLEKISERGQSSLSWRERWRMYRISKRKRENR